MDNLSVNKQHFDQEFSTVSVDRIVAAVSRAQETLALRIANNFSGSAAFYRDDFQQRIKDAEILELGAGNGLNALLMVALGAKRLVAVDISTETQRIIEAAAVRLGFQNISVVIGDLAQMEIPPASYDFVVGVAILHHLTHEQESAYLDVTRRILRQTGEARFLEPMRNFRLLDELRWLIPAAGRPSKLNAAAFQKWKDADPHPQRDHSSAHYEAVGRRFFEETRIIPSRLFERARRFFPNNTPSAKAIGRIGWTLDSALPRPLVRAFGSQQLIVYRSPKSTA
jgi:SAM-dependent methyltransferase